MARPCSAGAREPVVDCAGCRFVSSYDHLRVIYEAAKRLGGLSLLWRCPSQSCLDVRPALGFGPNPDDFSIDSREWKWRKLIVSRMTVFMNALTAILPSSGCVRPDLVSNQPHGQLEIHFERWGIARHMLQRRWPMSWHTKESPLCVSSFALSRGLSTDKALSAAERAPLGTNPTG